MKENFNNKDEGREIIEKYFSHWKWYFVSFIVFFVLAILTIRYSTEAYSIEAKIKINNDKADENVIEGYSKSNRIASTKDSSIQIMDEIELLKSRSLIEKVVKELNLNIQFFGQGKVKASEIYSNPPIAINFLINDSIINNLDTTLTVKIVSKSKYSLIEKGKKYSFGEKVLTSFGNIIITPNVLEINEIQNNSNYSIHKNISASKRQKQNHF